MEPPQQWSHLQSLWSCETKDLAHFDYLEPALLPEEDYEKNGCYSGSAIEHEGLLYLFYTGNLKDAEGNRKARSVWLYRKMALFWEKGPVIKEIPYTAHVRDPKIFKEKLMSSIWFWALREWIWREIQFTKSSDLFNWTFVGSLIDEKLDLGYMWECPDLIHFNEKSAFIFSPQGLEPNGEKIQKHHQTGYLTGDFQDETFRPDDLSFREMDLGFEFYAPQSFDYKDGENPSLGMDGNYGSRFGEKPAYYRK